MCLFCLVLATGLIIIGAVCVFFVCFQEKRPELALVADEVDLSRDTGLPSSSSSDDSSSSSSSDDSEASECLCSECEQTQQRRKKRYMFACVVERERERELMSE